MARKTTVPSKLTAEERRIEKEKEELLRMQRELEHRLVTLPLAIEKQRSQFEREARERARRAGAPISPGRAAKRPQRRHKATPHKRARAERVKLIALLVIFATILFLLLRAVPQG